MDTRQNHIGESTRPAAVPCDIGLDRRAFLGLAAAGVSAMCAGGTTATAVARSQQPIVPPKPQHLMCEFIVDPLGIDTARPRLSWQLASQRRGFT